MSARCGTCCSRLLLSLFTKLCTPINSRASGIAHGDHLTLELPQSAWFPLYSSFSCIARRDIARRIIQCSFHCRNSVYFRCIFSPSFQISSLYPRWPRLNQPISCDTNPSISFMRIVSSSSPLAVALGIPNSSGQA
jgi:hypothetical protein